MADTVPAWGDNPSSPLYLASYRSALRKDAVLGGLLAVAVILGSMPLFGLGIRGALDGVPYRPTWKARTSGARSMNELLGPPVQAAWSWRTDSGDFLLFELDTSADANAFADMVHESTMGDLGHPSALRSSHLGFGGPFRAWDSRLPDGRVLRTGAGGLPDRGVVWQEFRSTTDFDALGDFQARGWLDQGPLGYPFRRWIEVGGVFAMLAGWMWVVYRFGLRMFRVRRPPGTEPVSAELLEARLLGINALSDKFRLESPAPGTLECLLEAEGGEWSASGHGGDRIESRFIRLRLVSGEVRVVCGSTSRSVSGSGTGFRMQWNWGRGASYLPVHAEEHPPVWWQDGAFHVARGRTLSSDSDLLQALAQCCLESGWNLQPALW